MTTIATDGKTMAGDSQTTAGNEFVGYMTKVFRAPDGRIFGGCGSTTACRAFRRYMLEGGDKPALHEDFSALILNPDGTVDWIDRDHEPVRYMLPQAIGSGADFAIGAMLAGCGPAEAVAIACKRDVDSGGDITVESLT